VDVKQEPDGLDRMLNDNGGIRKVPTILLDGKVQIGYGGT
jgi:glutaredoxin